MSKGLVVIKVKDDLIVQAIKSRRNERIGPRELKVIKYIYENNLRKFHASDISKALRLDRRRVHDILKRLIRRKVLKKIKRGLYVVDDGFLSEIILRYKVRKLNGIKEPVRSSSKDVNDDNKRVHGCKSREIRVSDMFFSNVIGTLTNINRLIQKDEIRDWRYLSFFKRISHCELCFKVYGLSILGQLIIYTDSTRDGDNIVRIRYCPLKNLVRYNGIDIIVKRFWRDVLYALEALTILIIRKAPIDILWEYLDFLNSLGFSKILKSFKN